MIQLIKDENVVEEACVTAYVCKGRPEPSDRPAHQTGSQENSARTLCIASMTISRSAGYTEEDLKKMALDSPEKAILCVLS
jgi:hypothetical protein